MPHELRFRTPREGLDAFHSDLAVCPAPLDDAPTTLPLNDIIVCEGLFQQRDTKGNAYESDGHIRVLTTALSDAKVFDPVTVWWCGRGWALIDGHHRVRAYQRKGHIGDIPVQVFPGTPEDALMQSAHLNSRDKLVMTSQEKANTALRFCLLTKKSRKEIRGASGASDGLVAAIRRTIKELREQGHSDDAMLTKTWKELKEILNGEREMTLDIDEYTQREAAKILQALRPILGNNPVKMSDALAYALDQLPHELTRRAMNSQHFPVPWGELVKDPEEEPEDY